MDEKELLNNIQQRALSNYQVIEDKETELNAEVLARSKDKELILFELPLDFDKDLLKDLKIKRFRNGKTSRFLEDFSGICFDETDPKTKQLLGLFLKNDNKHYMFKSFNKYVKIFENVNLPSPKSENIIRRRLSLKKNSSRNKKKNRKITHEDL